MMSKRWALADCLDMQAAPKFQLLMSLIVNHRNKNYVRIPMSQDCSEDGNVCAEVLGKARGLNKYHGFTMIVVGSLPKYVPKLEVWGKSFCCSTQRSDGLHYCFHGKSILHHREFKKKRKDTGNKPCPPSASDLSCSRQTAPERFCCSPLPSTGSTAFSGSTRRRLVRAGCGIRMFIGLIGKVLYTRTSRTSSTAGHHLKKWWTCVDFHSLVPSLI